MKKIVGISIVIVIALIGAAYAINSEDSNSENVVVSEIVNQEEGPEGKFLTIEVKDGISAKGTP